MNSRAIMSKLSFNNIAWLMINYARKLGVLGILGLAIALCCCLFYTINIIPVQQQKSDAQLKLLGLKNHPEKPVLSEESAENVSLTQSTAEDIQHFYAQFPNGESLPKWLRLIDGNAAKQHLILNRGDYKLTQIKPKKLDAASEESSPNALSRYEIVLPVTGQYSQIRQFIAQVLHDLPALALSDMHIKRESAQSPTVEARLVFVLLLKGESWQ